MDSPTVTAKRLSLGRVDMSRYELKPEEIDNIKSVFDIFEVGKSGCAENLREAMKILGFDARNPIVSCINSQLDMPRPGSITFEEFLQIFNVPIHYHDTKEDIEKIFQLFDIDKNRTVAVKNLRKVARDIGEGTIHEDLLDLLANGDTNEDGLLSFDDFYNILTKKSSF